MNQESGKGIIFGVLGILTLIIAIMGASLAYFTASAMSGEDPIEVTAATVTISYIQGQILRANELIPATSTVVDWAYERGADEETGEDLQCKDAKGYQVCSVFRFDASNELGRNDQRIIGTITTTTDLAALEQENEFRNLSYTVYTVSDNGERTKINPELTKMAQSGGKTQLFNNGSGDASANEVLIEAGAIKHFEIVVWLNEQATDIENDKGEGNQDDEQGLSYTGLVEISISNASDKVTGEIGE